MYEVFGRRLDSRKLSTPFNELARLYTVSPDHVSQSMDRTRRQSPHVEDGCGSCLGVSACSDLFFLRLHRRPTISDIRNRPEMQKARTCVAIGM